MVLERDEFIVTFDSTKVTEEILIATIKKSGYTAQIVSDQPSEPVSVSNVPLPQGFPLLDDALARAKKERKPIVLDFYAEWCAPCKKMEKTTFTDTKVKALLERAIWLKIDTDKEVELSKQLEVVGLPDFRLVTPDGKTLRQLRGYLNADSFAAELEWLLKQSESK
jgi:thiol:disulfide interchange protein